MKLKLDACALIECEKLSLFPLINQLYEAIIITDEVYKETIEIGMKLHKSHAMQLKQKIDQNLILRKAARSVLKGNLGAGEAETIGETMIEQKNNEDVAFVTVDKRAMKEAIQEHLEVRSIDILLVEACLRNLITEKEFDQKIKEYDNIHKLSLIRITELKHYISEFTKMKRGR